MQYFNRKARFSYQLLEEIEAGIVLEGSEAKGLREHGVNLDNAFAKISDGEVFLINAIITIPQKKNYVAGRTRKLLLKRGEIVALESKIKAKKLTLVPVKLYNKGRFYKVTLALAKSKREFEKKELIKKRDIEREIAKDL